MSMSSGQSTHRAPEPLLQVAMAVEASLSRVAGHPVRYRGARPASDAPDQYLVSFDVEGQLVQAYAMDDEPAAAVMAILTTLTDQLAEIFWGEPVPRCPGHAHPMRPVLDADGSVAWHCPVDGREVDRIWPP